MPLEDLGYNSYFEEKRNELGFNNFSVGRVTAENKGSYQVKNADGEYLAKIRGKQSFNATSREDYPAVGDWVAITPQANSDAIIEGILPRLAAIKRTYGNKSQILATNVDSAFIVESAGRDYNLNRFERYFSLAKAGGVKPAIILNKIDLLSEKESAEKLGELKSRFPDTEIIFTSILSGVGLQQLKNYIAKGSTYCFLGSSGVGKSSLINTLLGENTIKTGSVSSVSGRGKHVTTGRQMYFLSNGGIVVDNPGIREVGISNSAEGVNLLFEDITNLAQTCKYADCSHTHEPECTVLSAVKSGILNKEKYSNYLNLKKEAGFHAMDDFQKREKNRRFGKFIKNTKKQLKNYGHKN